MKKYLVVGLLLLLPLTASADSKAGLEFLTPLVQQIITLLHDRIAVLSAEVQFLRANQPVCGAVQPPVVQTVVQPDPRKEEAERVKLEYARLYITLDERANAVRAKQREARDEIVRLSTGITAYQKYTLDRVITDGEIEMGRIAQERSQLSIEERRKLVELGVY